MTLPLTTTAPAATAADNYPIDFLTAMARNSAVRNSDAARRRRRHLPDTL